jgi:hypothetical protein
MKLKQLLVKTIFTCSFSLLVLTGHTQSSATFNLSEQSPEKSGIKYLTTFKIENCNKISLQYYHKMANTKDGKPSKTLVMTDTANLDKENFSKILALIKALPDTGTKMTKMSGDVPLLNVILTTDKGEMTYFSFCYAQVKTTDASFYMDPRPKEEKILYGLLLSLLFK